MASSEASRRGAWHRWWWMIPALAGLIAVELLSSAAYYYGYHPGWLSGGHGLYNLALQRGQSVTLIVTLALWLMAIGGFWWPRRRERLAISLIVVAVMVLNTMALGISSYLPCRGDVSVVGMLFWVLELFVGQPPDLYQGAALTACAGAPPVGLQLAEIVGLGATLTGAVTVVAQQRQLRLWIAQDATVLIGLDKLTLPLLRQIARQRRRGALIVIEPDEANPLLDEARATGAQVIEGGQSWARLLRPIIVGTRGCSLSYLYALLGDVSENEEILQAVETILENHPPDPERLPQLLVRIDDPRHANSWRGRHGGRIRTVLADALSPAETTASALVDSIYQTAPEHLVIGGDGNLTIALLFELGRRAREWKELARAGDDRAPSPPVSLVTLIAPKATDIQQEYQDGAPLERNSAPPFALRTSTGRWEDRLLPQLRQMTPAQARKTAIVITDSFTEAGMQCAGRASRLHPATVIYLQAPAGVGISQPIFDQLRLYRLGLLASDQVPEDTWTRIARHWHECRRLENSMPDSPTRLPWAALSLVVRQDNVLQVRSLLSTVVDLGREWIPRRMLVPGSFIELSASEIEAVARREHDRWFRRQLRRKSGNPKAMPWDELTDEDRQRNRDAAVEHIAQIEGAGFLPNVPLGGLTDAQRYERTGFVWAWRLNAPLRWSFRPGQQLSGNVGDWHVSDARGQSRTVSDPEFRASHERAGYGRWQRTGTFRAWPAGEPLVLRTKEGDVTAAATDMVVEGPGGERWPVPAEQFQRTYRLADDVITTD